MARRPSPKDLDGFQPLLATTDTKRKLCIGNDLISYLGEPSNSIECVDIGLFIDGLIPWMHSSNFKVCQNGLDAMTYLVDRMGGDFRPYLQTVLPPIIERLGDGKDMVREKSQLLLLKMMERDVVSPQSLMEKLTPAFNHKNSRIREEVLTTLTTTINEHGAQSMSVSRLIPSIVKLLSDPCSNVRDAAFSTLVEVYRHVGDKLRQDLLKKQQVPPAKLPALIARFDELRDEGAMLPTAVTGDALRDEDEVDRVLKSATKKPVSAPVPPPKKMALLSSKPTPAAGGQGCALDEEQFMRQFEEVPSVQLFSGRELEEQLNSIRQIITDQSKDWNKRVDALKRIRSLIIAGAAGYDELYTHLRSMELPFQDTIKDLRSLVVREACITVAYLSQQLKSKLDHFAEAVLATLINLIQNSAKVVASAGVVTIRFILANTHAPRLIPIIAANVSSKSRDIRRACCEFLDQLLHTWSKGPLERHIPAIQDAINKGIADADPEARLSSRKAFWGFKDHFPEQADILLNSLDSSYKRALFGELSLSNSSSNSSLHHPSHLVSSSRYGQVPASLARTRPQGGSTENLHQHQQQPPQPQPQQQCSLSRQSSLRSSHRSGIPVPKQSFASKQNDSDGVNRRAAANVPSPMLRSNSAIDAAAAQRVKARAQYAALDRQKIGSGASLQDDDLSARARKSPSVTSPERLSRARSRVARVSLSQPTSRSGSPSSRLSYVTYGMRADSSQGDDCSYRMASLGSMGRQRRLPSGIPRSTTASRDTSRETSPNRFGALGGHLHDRSFGSKLRGMHSISPAERPPQSSRPVMAQKILQQSREAESALADALTMDGSDINRMSPRKTYRPFEDHSDDSETSSVCSERSFESFRRPSDSYSWSGSQQRLYRDTWEPVSRDISEIIGNCASTHWADRKEGLIGLQNYFQAGNVLTATELRRVTDIFSKMFMDSHTKVFSLFLDTLNELILSHHEDLKDFLYILLTRLLNKSGADLLVSQQNKINKSLEVVRDSFPCDLQMHALLRFLTDPAQTPNTKVKVATLRYLTQLASMMDPSGFNGSGDQTGPALAKIISWTMSEGPGSASKSGAGAADVRKAAQQALIALFNLNMPQVTRKLGTLSKEYQEAAANLLESHPRRSNSSGADADASHSNGLSSSLSSPSASPSPSTPTPPQLHFSGTPPPAGVSPRSDLSGAHRSTPLRSSPLRSLANHPPALQHPTVSPLPPLHGLDLGDENLNPEEVYKSLRRTTAEIQNYSFEPLSGSKLADRDRDTTSQDSGISQMSAGPTDKVASLEERIEDLNISGSTLGRSSLITSPTHRLRDCNGVAERTSSGDSVDGDNSFKAKVEEEDKDDVESIRKSLESIRSADGPDCEAKLASLRQLAEIIREGRASAIADQLKNLLRVILEQLILPESQVRASVLEVLTEMVRKRELASFFSNYTELLVLRVLHAPRDGDMEVMRQSEGCAAVLATCLPPDGVIRLLLPLIMTGEYPLTQSSLRMLTKLVEHHGREVVEPHLNELMPAIIKAYDNNESPVRKAAVFCMVALHVALGEETLAPFLATLTRPKLKLLHLYIKRAYTREGQTSSSSGQTSPKNGPA